MGGWVRGRRFERATVRYGWVGGWVGEWVGTFSSAWTSPSRFSFLLLLLLFFSMGGWVGGWVGGCVRGWVRTFSSRWSSPSRFSFSPSFSSFSCVAW